MTKAELKGSIDALKNDLALGESYAQTLGEFLVRVQQSHATMHAKCNLLELQIDQLPADPPAPVEAPTGFRVLSTYGGVENAPLYIELACDLPAEGGLAFLVEVKAAEGNPNGPQDWSPVAQNASQDGATGLLTTYPLNLPYGQAVVFSVRWVRSSDGALSERALLPFPVIAPAV